MTHTRPKIPGRFWAYASAVLGGCVSIAANIAHSFIPPHGSPATWTPEPGAVASAIVWPVFLFAALETLVRVPWYRGIGWGLARFGGLLPVAAVAAFVSYRHLSGLLAHYGEESVVTLLGPLSVDGLMVMATAALLVIHRRKAQAATPATAPSNASPSSATTSAPATSVAEAAPVPSAPARKAPARKAAPGKAPAVKAPAKQATPRKTTPAPAAVEPSPTVVQPSVVPARVGQPQPVPARPGSAPSTTDTRVTASDAARTLATPVPAALLSRAEHIARAHRDETGTPITPGELAVRLRVGTATAAQLLGVLAQRPDNPATPIPTVNGAPVKATR